VNAGKHTINYPTKVAIGPLKDSNMTAQSTGTNSNATEDIGVEETNLSSSEEINDIELNNSNDNNSESDNDSSSHENKSSKISSTPGFGLLGSLTCLYGGWKLRKK
jgi:DNA-binding beta-propeller fold protein YncE